MFNEFITCFFVLFNSFLIYFLYRNHKVYKLRMFIISEVSKLAKEDIINNKDFEWRYDEFERVSYNDMMYNIFKGFKAKNYWKDLSFLK